MDIRELISLEDVMETEEYGPNGGLVYCMEYLCQNLEWLEEKLGDYTDDYLIIDCPGQIELYTHFPHMKIISQQLTKLDYSVCAVWLIDSSFIVDSSKFLSATLIALSAMIQLELPHVNVLTKMDLLGKKKNSSKMDKYLEPDIDFLINEVNKETGIKFYSLNQAIGTLISEYNMVNFYPLDITDTDSIIAVLAQIDNATQYGEDLEPKEPNYEFDTKEDIDNKEFGNIDNDE